MTVTQSNVDVTLQKRNNQENGKKTVNGRLAIDSSFYLSKFLVLSVLIINLPLQTRREMKQIL